MGDPATEDSTLLRRCMDNIAVEEFHIIGRRMGNAVIEDFKMKRPSEKTDIGNKGIAQVPQLARTSI